MKFSHRSRNMISLAIFLALLASATMVQASPVRAGAINPTMSVTLISGNSTYASTVRAGNPIIFRAQIKNSGDMPLGITANLTVPAQWEVDQEKYSDCPESLEARKTCTVSWYFTPQAAGQVYLRVYVRGYYTDPTGATRRITQSPAFIFNVVPAKGEAGTEGTGGTTTGTNSNLPGMAVTLSTGGSTYAATVFAGKPLIFRAQVKNTGGVPLQVTANLTVPQNWDVDQDPFSDCPESLGKGSNCTISWYFTPQAAGQVYLRVYVRGAYTLASGVSSRITSAPAFIFNVKPAKVQE